MYHGHGAVVLGSVDGIFHYWTLMNPSHFGPYTAWFIPTIVVM
jgi:hypothetical protein